MSLKNCPKCGKEMNDDGEGCSYCGSSISTVNLNSKVSFSDDEANVSGELESSKSHKKVSKNNRILIAIISIILVVAIAVGAYFVITKNNRYYNKAVSLYNSGNYNDSLVLFNKINDYEDSSEYIKKCNFEMSTNGQFLRALAKGLEKRWDLNDADEADEKDTTTEQFRQFVNAEYEQINQFADKNFEDPILGEYAKGYINVIKKMLGVVKYYGSNNETFWSEYNPLYDERCVLIKKICDKYTVPVKADRKTNLDDLITNGEYTIEIQEILDSTKFEKKSEEYGWKEYQAIVKNTTSTDFSFFYFSINLLDKDGTVVQSTSATTNNWSVGSKHKFTFSTNESFDKIVIESCSYS